MQDESYLSEHSLREALDRMGMGSKEMSVSSGGAEAPPHHGHGGSKGRSVSRGRPLQPAVRRRRFAGDDTVVVEHQSLGRPSQKRNTNRMSVTAEVGQEQERLKQSLQRERRRAHDAETELAVLNERIRAVNTQMTHLRLQVEEGKKAIQQRDDSILRLRAELHQVREQKNRRVTPPPKVKTVSADVEDDQEPAPVQWWTD